MSIAKLGYFLIGLGSGILASSFILAHEFRKPIGEIEEFIPPVEENEDDDFSKDNDGDSKNGQESSGYIPQNGIKKRNDGRDEAEDGRDSRTSDNKDGEEAHTEFSSNYADVLNYYTSADEAARSGKSQKTGRKQHNHNDTTPYHKMFKGHQAPINGGMDDILHAVSSRAATKDSYDTDDSPSDDIPEEDSSIYDDYSLERIEEGLDIFIGEPPYDFDTLTYYAGDTTLANENDEIIPNPEDYIGTVAIDRLVKGGPECPNGVIFVRNVKTGMNYEVILDVGYYSQIVLGIDPNDRLNNGGGFGGSNG